eukprot:TRINITY_DN1463_c0_g2_i2.p2 TRINITY_DN1463_c0_g2~~TRINITY_DN1463_c0_g2_i2.p2  ORF type:complete len:196 (+),score=44.88 TRINITY_DN1463_c0_g2_i2:1202-1789(+)
MQKALEGSSRIIILAMISQSVQYYDESMNTISFATRAKSIVQIVHRNKANPLIDPATKQAYESKILALERRILKLEQTSLEKGRVASTELDCSLDTKETLESKYVGKFKASMTPRKGAARGKKAAFDLTSEMELQLENQIGSLKPAEPDFIDANIELKEITEIDNLERVKQQEAKLKVRVWVSDRNCIHRRSYLK